MINGIARIIFIIGTKIRNPSYFDAYFQLKRSESISLNELENIQLKKLKKLLRFSIEHSPYYKKKLRNLRLEGKNIEEILTQIEVVNKTDLIENNHSIHTIESYKFKKVFYSETSGSSGQSLVFYKNEEWDSFNRASIARGMSWHDVSPWQYNGYFWGYSLSKSKRFKTKIFDFILNRYRLFSYSEDDVLDFLKKTKNATYIGGYSSMIYEVAKVGNGNSLFFDNVKMIKGTSEKIYDHYHKETQKCFGLNIISEYGAAESGIIAFECKEGNMHINEEQCIVETNCRGEIIVTNLKSYSFPIIRYALGDYVTLGGSDCKCGLKHRVISDVLGRVGKNILGNNDSKFPSLTLYYIFKNLAIKHNMELNFKGVQNQVGFLDILLEVERCEQTGEKIREEAYSYFGENIKINVIYSQVIHDKNGKFKDFESHLC